MVLRSVCQRCGRVHEIRSAPRLEKIAQAGCIGAGALTGVISTALMVGSPWGEPALVLGALLAAAVLAALAGGALGAFVYWLVAGMFKLMNRTLDGWESRALEPYRRQRLPRAQLVKS
jgi:hypothetical protein